VEKCVFAQADIVYCAVPQLLHENDGLQKGVVASNDSLYRIHLSTGEVSLLAFPDEPTRMLHLVVSDDERSLYFSDPEGRIHLMKLQ
jgi:hypothetical protein